MKKMRVAGLLFLAAMLSGCATQTSSSISNSVPSSSISSSTSSSSSSSSSSKNSSESSSTVSSSTSTSSPSSSSEVPSDQELITNGTFDTGSTDPFVKSDFEGASSTIEVATVGTEKMMKLAIKSVSWGQAAPRIEYSNLTLKDKKIYVVSFDAYAETARTMHIQVGQLLTADPWFKAASSQGIFLDLGTAKKTYKWSFTVDAALGSDLTKESLLMEFGKMGNGAPSDATNVFLDNISLKETATPILDTTAPIITLDAKESFFVGEAFKPLEHVHARDDVDANVTPVIDTVNSVLPSVDANSLITADPGNYKVVFIATDTAKNSASATWNFTVVAKVETVNGFNLNGFKAGKSGDEIPDDDTTKGVVYAADKDTTYSYADGALTIHSTQNADTDEWTATQVFARSVRQKTGGNYNLSFDINSSVAGVIQVGSNFVDNVGYPIIVGDNHISLEKNIFEGNYADLTVVFGTHVTIQQPQKNIGPFDAVIKNFSFVTSAGTADVEAPVIKLNAVKTYFTGDAFNAMNEVTITDNRDANPTLSLVAEESNLPPVDSNGILTTGGTYYAVYKGVDATGNTKKFKAFFTIKALPVGTDHFGFEDFIYGEQWAATDPTTPMLWNDGAVKVTRECKGYNSLHFTTDQATTNAFYATQLFFRSLKVDTFGVYKLSYTLTSSVAGNITIDNTSYTLKVGDNLIERNLTLRKGDAYNASIQLGTNADGNIGPCEMSMTVGLSYQKDLSESKAWSVEGTGMTATVSGTDNIIAYTNIPDPFWNVNARIYDFTDKSKIQAIIVSFIGTKGATYQFKAEGLDSSVAQSTSVVATGDEQKAMINCTNFTADQKSQFCKILFFVETVGASGTCTIHGYQIFDDIHDTSTSTWTPYGGATASTAADGTATIGFNNVPDSWWTQDAQYITEKNKITTATTKVVFTFTGAKDNVFLFKILGAIAPDYSNYIQQDVTATGEQQTVTLDISAIPAASRPDYFLLDVFSETSGFTGTLSFTVQYL
jgi:hypothetical protein